MICSDFFTLALVKEDCDILLLLCKFLFDKDNRTEAEGETELDEEFKELLFLVAVIGSGTLLFFGVFNELGRVMRSLLFK